MCGVVGELKLDADCLASPEIVAAMARTLAHRGPDDQGVWHQGPVALGHRRLSIIDVSGGHQPLSNEDGTIWISYNGEVYNFQDLAREVTDKGHRLATRCDTEVLVHLYEEEGPEFVQKLNGMFAVAIWDCRRRRLVLARDRLGKKPLYWGVFQNTLVFASELKAILTHPLVPRRLDLNSLSRYFAVAAVPAPFSIFEGIYKLPPAGRLVVENGEVRVDTFWEYPLAEKPANVTFQEAQDRFLELLRQAVQRRLVSEVPLGVFLSGGLDSSAVAALMCQVSPNQVNSFSIGFEDRQFDESSYARMVAKHLGTRHHEQRVSPADGLTLVPLLGRLLDEPLADASIIPTYLLSRFAREHVTVALGGDGGDELLAGYPLYAAHRYARHFDRIPAWFRRGLMEPWADALPARWNRFGPIARTRKLLRSLRRRPGLDRHYEWKRGLATEEQRQLFSDDAWEIMSCEAGFDQARKYVSACKSTDLTEQMMFLDTKLFLQDVVLVKVDRASMAVSLEVRAPILDVEVVEFLASLPLSYKLRGTTTKHLFKEAARRLLPAEIIDRPKQGFAVPVASWLRHDFRPLLEDLLTADRLNRFGLFRPTFVRQLLDEHFAGRRDHHKYLWPLLMFELWNEEYGCAADAPGHLGQHAAPQDRALALTGT